MPLLKELEGYGKIEDEQLKLALDTAVQLVIEHEKDFRDCFPACNSENNFYPKTENVDWTTGFYTGEIWLAYEHTKNEVLLHGGERQVASFFTRIQEKVEVAHHDMGFLYSPSCIAAYMLTGSETGKEAAILAADNLLTRFQEKGQFFQAWGELGAKDNYRLIIDCLLNMPLLFWASEVTGHAIYREKAEAHIKTAMQYVVRPDHSTYHTYFFDPQTGQPLKGVTHQGHRDDSAWARGQAWGIYGTALSYKRMKNPEYIELFRELTNYFLENLPSDLIPYWDFDFNDGSQEPRDSSSAAIAACGMVEMAKHMEGEEGKYYTNMAKRLCKALWERCAVKDKKESNGLLLHGTYARASVNNPCPNRGMDECNTWGDYYYLELLTRLSREWESYW